MDADAKSAENPFYLPDFCTSRATLAIVLIVELTAIGEDVNVGRNRADDAAEALYVMPRAWP